MWQECLNEDFDNPLTRVTITDTHTYIHTHTHTPQDLKLGVFLLHSRETKGLKFTKLRSDEVELE